ncbi:MAG: hypothetical protein WAU81_05405 [Candidatus Aminicenantales bacterium]
MAKIDPKYLKGIKMTGAKTELIEKNGRKVNKSTPWERPAREEDVLSWKDYGEYIVVAINDGKKYPVNKKEPAPEEKKTEDKKK